jgi:hypothetical protein
MLFLFLSIFVSLSNFVYRVDCEVMMFLFGCCGKLGEKSGKKYFKSSGCSLIIMWRVDPLLGSESVNIGSC